LTIGQTVFYIADQPYITKSKRGSVCIDKNKQHESYGTIRMT
jgi:hypothetical protein